MMECNISGGSYQGKARMPTAKRVGSYQKQIQYLGKSAQNGEFFEVALLKI